MNAQELRQRLNDLRDLADFRPFKHIVQSEENEAESHEESRFESSGMKTVLEKYVPRFEAKWSGRQDFWDEKLVMKNYVELSRCHKVDLNTGHVRWLTVQANLVPGRDKDIILNVPVFWFMQFYPWYLRPYKDTYRLFVGFFAIYRDECELWVGWCRTEDDLPVLKFYGHSDVGSENYQLDITPDLRKHIEWHEPLNRIFEFNNMKSKDDETTNVVAKWQDAHILAVAKVLARFPGLVFERHPEDEHKIYQVNGRDWAKFPFADREEDRDNNPYRKFTAYLNSGDQGELSDGDNEGINEDETGYFNDISDDELTPEELAAENNDPTMYADWAVGWKNHNIEGLAEVEDVEESESEEEDEHEKEDAGDEDGDPSATSFVPTFSAKNLGSVGKTAAASRKNSNQSNANKVVTTSSDSESTDAEFDESDVEMEDASLNR